MNIVQNITKYEISMEDCLQVQGGTFTPSTYCHSVPNSLHLTKNMVEEAEKPDNGN